MPTDFAFSHRVEVRFRDCDPMGHVNHAVYLSYLEQCRFAFWRQLTGAAAGPASGIIIARVECDYRAPAFFGEVLEVRLKVTDIGRSSFVVVYDITDTASERRLADAKTVLVSYDYAAGKPTAISDTLRAQLERAR
jgi:acyl-CoA thioester hydrolase